ncbi:hypothetical protein F5148DRAFT_1150710 [Russula earlei]|uniref:Uncharacterized protein n=1 Tax=Russula earlei TaxID=71964 RepID=A0ACC0U362_9AGAM|nr:hypothetical protein F5148DRAFT_1150710 [Russula earlei]
MAPCGPNLQDIVSTVQSREEGREKRKKGEERKRTQRCCPGRCCEEMGYEHEHANGHARKTPPAKRANFARFSGPVEGRKDSVHGHFGLAPESPRVLEEIVKQWALRCKGMRDDGRARGIFAGVDLPSSRPWARRRHDSQIITVAVGHAHDSWPSRGGYGHARVVVIVTTPVTQEERGMGPEGVSIMCLPEKRETGVEQRGGERKAPSARHRDPYLLLARTVRGICKRGETENAPNQCLGLINPSSRECPRMVAYMRGVDTS